MGRRKHKEAQSGIPARVFRTERLCVDDNAMPVEGVEKLCDFIKAFDKNN